VLLGAGDPLPYRPSRVVVAGVSGAGKTTLARLIGTGLGLPAVELDALYHGPAWIPRPGFADDVRRFTATAAWVTEWQYTAVRPLLTTRADLLVWLDLSVPRTMAQVVWRTVRRRLRGEVLWGVNVEAPLVTVLRDREHIVRWAWSTRHALDDLPDQVAVLRAAAGASELPVVRLRSHRDARRWLDGPLADAARRGPA
jgi:adenylate kinase family enzyme